MPQKSSSFTLEIRETVLLDTQEKYKVFLNMHRSVNARFETHKQTA